MSKQGAEAEAIQMAEAAEAQEAEVGSSPIATFLQAREAGGKPSEEVSDSSFGSFLREIKPKEGSEEAQAAEEKREAISEVMEGKDTMSFAEAMEKVVSFTGLKKLFYFAKECRSAKLIYIRHLGGSRWIAAPHKEAVDNDASKKLADNINSQRRKLVEEKKEGRKNAAAADKQKSLESFELDKLKEVIEGIEDLKKLTDFVYDTKRAGLIKVTGGRKWEVSEAEDLEGSAELVQAINSRKKKLRNQMFRARALEKKQEEKLERKLAGIERAINEKEDVLDLEKLTFQFLDQKLGMVKKTNGRRKGEWSVEVIEGKKGSAEVVKMVLERKAVLEVRGKTADLIGKYNQ